MPERFTDDGRPAESAGLIGHLSALLAAKLAYLRARLELAGIEGKEAAIHIAIILGLVIAALIVAVFAYLFFVLALIFLIGRAFGDNAWVWVLFVAAAAHLAFAALFLIVARIKLGTPLFPLTLEELKKDQEWLKTNAKPH